MVYQSEQAEKESILAVAKLMVTAARTARKTRGADNIETLVVDGEEKDRLAREMRRIAEERNAPNYERDAGCLDNSEAVVLIGVRNNPAGLPICGWCGFANCAESKRVGARCVFNSSDLGTATGSAVVVAMNHFVDNRIMYSIGYAATLLKMMPDGVMFAYGIPLSAKGKNPYFDREILR